MPVDSSRETINQPVVFFRVEQHIEGSVVQRNTGPTRVVSVRALLQLYVNTWTLPVHPGVIAIQM